MTKKKSILLVIIMILFLLFLNGCNNDYNHQEYVKSIYDNNTKIIEEKRACEFSKYITGIRMDLKYFNGIDTIYSIKAGVNNSITIDYNSEVTKGNFKCILITHDLEIINILEQTEKGTKTFILPKGDNVIKLVGKNDAFVKFNIKFTNIRDTTIKYWD